MKANLTFEEVGWHWRKYQKDLFNDPSQLIAIVKSRQIGMSEALAFYPIIQTARCPGQNVLLVSTNHKKAKDLLRKVERWIQASLLLDPSLSCFLGIEASNASEIKLRSGSAIKALPCKPHALRGETGTVILDEVDHYQNVWDVYDAIAPAITSDKTQRMKMILSSTPLGENRILYKIFHDEKFGSAFSKHNIDVYKAIEDGHNKKVLQLKDQYSEDIWAQEFECSFIGDQETYFSYDLMSSCSSVEPFSGQDLFVGIDVGRTKDRTSWVVLTRKENDFSVHSFGNLKNGLPHNQQLEQLKEIISKLPKPPEKIVIDARGEGSGLSDFLSVDYKSRLVRYKATNQGYDYYIPRLKQVLETGKSYIPNDPMFLGAFSKIKKVIGENSVKYVANRDATGHADLFYATLMAFSEFYKEPKPPSARPSANLVQMGHSKIRSY